MHFHLIKENLILLILISLISSCALQNNEPKPTLSTKEVASILNDGCTINRDRKKDTKLMGNAIKLYPLVGASNKEEWPLGMDQISMGS